MILRKNRIPDTYTYCVLYSFSWVSFSSATITLNGDEKNGYKCKINKEGEEDITLKIGPIFENYKKIIKELFKNIQFNLSIKNIINEINKSVNLYAQTFTTRIGLTFPFIPITQAGYIVFNISSLVNLEIFKNLYILNPNALFKEIKIRILIIFSY